ETEGKGFGGGYLSRWIVLGVFLLAVAGGAYALLHDRLAVPTERLKQAELQAALADSDFQVALIPVEGMTCAACAARVKRTLEDIEGVVSAEVGLAERNVKVRYVDKKLSSENLVAAINALGYKARAPIAAKRLTEEIDAKASRQGGGGNDT
ncbi:MAG: heavy-metal-associated domain-containing protein, partial [Sulfuricaulis sp.]|nr:heavy-metal-associated domain-containing protein [Sulfuricaulis sp.]